MLLFTYIKAYRYRVNKKREHCSFLVDMVPVFK